MESHLKKEVVAKLALEAKFDDFGLGLHFRKSTYTIECRRFAKNAIQGQKRKFGSKWSFAITSKALSLFLTYPFLVMAHMEDPHVIQGHIEPIECDAKTQVIRPKDKTVINCKSFNIKKDETVRFVQEHQKDRVLCRVTGKEASIIEGRLEANGRLFLVNPQSIFFRETAHVNVHSLIASTLNIKDEDFVKGNYRFFLDSKDSAIINHGQITAEQDVVFMAPQIANRAVIKAVAGRVAFVGGDLITLNFEGDNLISFAIDGTLKTGFIEQAGQIESGTGVLLKLRVADEVIKSVVNVNGLIEASALHVENGKIYLVSGSSIAAPNIKVEAPIVENTGNFTAKKIEIIAGKELRWQGGYIKGKPSSTDLDLNAPNGMLLINASIGFPDDKDEKKIVALKSLTINSKIIDQNASIKTTGPITYTAETTFLGGNISSPNTSITFNGPVILDDNVEISNGFSKGNTVFNGTLDGDRHSRSLKISNGDSGAVSFNGPIGSKEPLHLSIATGKLSLHNVGDKNHSGAESLSIKAKTVDLLGSVVHAKQQTWEAPAVYLKSGQPTTFMTNENRLVFKPTSHIYLGPETSVAFETRGGALEVSKLSGDHQQSITITTGQGDANIGEFIGKLGPLQVHSSNVHFTGKIEAASVFMEAQTDIDYAADSQGKIFRTEICSEGDVTLNAKRGTIGTKNLPILIKSKGKIYVGSKSFAYVDGSCVDGFPSVYPQNPPPRIVFNKNEIQYLFNAEIFMEQEELISLTPDLYHTAPHGFVDAKNFTPRGAPIYYQVK